MQLVQTHLEDALLGLTKIVMRAILQPNPTLLHIMCFLLMQLLWICTDKNSRFVDTHLGVEELGFESSHYDFLIILDHDGCFKWQEYETLHMLQGLNLDFGSKSSIIKLRES